ncbi:phenylalanine--tRNA ligase subunit beta [Candidatus Aquiluna sp. UB-MaderosW2red]|uniref:phenylalanine--tRNA ligase subunit beta n=1 Tax=Candidatus Aquiluna sp. UB-MaderosW2red TaxID=1855377 RepID=UPI000875C385|nr:phenylalanine--tRNA ligase subunit beta [Candidatus Aquiluna sp. UB-MaderosW2red]SCX13146.1 phenylalanyl-tRNA synthetase beta chain [Candidatus Aquiluna sp. UB-MaderosW2red]
MRIPLSWLRESVDLEKEATPNSVMAQLVKVGLEEEGSHGGELSGPIVVGEVLEFADEPQSNGKTIRWCKVRVARDGELAADGGGDVRGIVCGASNFLIGDKVVVSLPGAVLPGNFVISARKTYGHVSDGMIASARELSLSDEHDGILRLITVDLDPEVGTNALALLGLNESAAEVNVTPDRGYCLSIRGIAREYSHASKVLFTDPASRVKVSRATGFPLVIDDLAPIHGIPGVSRFRLLSVTGINAKALVPDWMKTRLQLAGMRSISIAVDITNYVMLELGQPLHAYDQQKISGGISVRRALAEEQLKTLDEKVRKLSVEDLVICDESGPIGMAGVMGGFSTEVSDGTTDLLLEAAVFDPISIARSSRRHKLPSEASKRFERGVDPEVGLYALYRAAALLEEFASGRVTNFGAEFSIPVSKTTIELPIGFAGELVGVSYTKSQISEVLLEIGCEVVDKTDFLSVTAPSWRPDLKHKTDLVEEVARLLGYDLIPSRIPTAPPGRGLTARQKFRRRVVAALSGSGHVEVLNYPFVSTEQNSWFNKGVAVVLENAMQSEFPELRRSLIAPLLIAAQRNISRGLTSLALYEEGSVFLEPKGQGVSSLPLGGQRPSASDLRVLNESIPEQPKHVAGVLLGDWILQAPGQKAIEAGYPQAIDAVSTVIAAAGIRATITQKVVPGFHPGRAGEVFVLGKSVGYVGELDPAISEELHLPRRVGVYEINLDAVFALAPEVLVASELRIMPAATQDLSLVVGIKVPAGEVSEAIYEGAGELLEEVRLVDDYRGTGVAAGSKSLTFSLVFRAQDRTLTQIEATDARDKAVALAFERFQATLRA